MDLVEDPVADREYITDSNQCCGTPGCALDPDGVSCYTDGNYPGRTNTCDGGSGGGGSCSEITDSNQCESTHGCEFNDNGCQKKMSNQYLRLRLGGDCLVDDYCFYSPNYDGTSEYPPNTACNFEVLKDFRFDVQAFDVEEDSDCASNFDYLQINAGSSSTNDGPKFCGSNGPGGQQVYGPPGYNQDGDNIYWQSDNGVQRTGFKICAVGGGSLDNDYNNPPSGESSDPYSGGSSDPCIGTPPEDCTPDIGCQMSNGDCVSMCIGTPPEDCTPDIGCQMSNGECVSMSSGGSSDPYSGESSYPYSGESSDPYSGGSSDPCIGTPPEDCTPDIGCQMSNGDCVSMCIGTPPEDCTPDIGCQMSNGECVSMSSGGSSDPYSGESSYPYSGESSDPCIGTPPEDCTPDIGCQMSNGDCVSMCIGTPPEDCTPDIGCQMSNGECVSMSSGGSSDPYSGESSYPYSGESSYPYSGESSDPYNSDPYRI